MLSLQAAESKEKKLVESLAQVMPATLLAS